MVKNKHSGSPLNPPKGDFYELFEKLKKMIRNLQSKRLTATIRPLGARGLNSHFGGQGAL